MRNKHKPFPSFPHTCSQLNRTRSYVLTNKIMENRRNLTQTFVFPSQKNETKKWMPNKTECPRACAQRKKLRRGPKPSASKNSCCINSKSPVRAVISDLVNNRLTQTLVSQGHCSAVIVHQAQRLSILYVSNKEKIKSCMCRTKKNTWDYGHRVKR